MIASSTTTVSPVKVQLRRSERKGTNLYSQNNEEEVLLQHLPAAGRALDIGAFDGKTFSNTLALIEKGWEAVLVEPSPHSFVSLAQLHKDNPRVKLVHALVDVEPAPLVKFWNTQDAVGTSEQAHYDLWKGHGGFQEIWVPALSVAALLTAFPREYTFVNVDTEGSTGRIFDALPLQEMGYPVVCVEHNSKERNPIQQTIDRHNANGANYRLVLDNSENFIYVR